VSPDVHVEIVESRVELVVDVDRGDRIEITSGRPKGVTCAFTGLEPLVENPVVRLMFAPPLVY
jgi:hypothetical protein